MWKPSLRERCWGWRQTVNRAASLLLPANWPFASAVLGDAWRSMVSGVSPVAGQTRERADAAAEWLLRAQEATPDDGVSVGYFPTHADAVHGWLPSYPETTGYIIQSLLDYSGRFGRPDVAERARAMGHWEASVQMPSGAVQAGPVCAPENQSPAVFNTGMVLQGWTALLAQGPDPVLSEAARKAADFLVADQGDDGHLRTHGPFVADARVKTYNCLCAWALHRFADLSGEQQYASAAVRAVEASVGEQNEAGWFAHNCLTRSEAPLTHTIGYSLQGILETGVLAGREDFIEAAKRGTDAVLARVRPNGYLAGRFNAAWDEVGSNCCLTGSAQIAIVSYRLHALFGNPEHRAAADRLVDFLKGTQRVTARDPGVRGALAGSFPLYGPYMTWGYPNWATKYLLDSLMLQEAAAR